MPRHAEFAMPKPVRIMGRASSITNSFVNGIIPVIPPTPAEVDEALRVLGMETALCAYCGDRATEWDHLRPLVMNKQPTGYISEIHNLVPACGKCNQSKGNKPWREWLFSAAPLSPSTRGVPGVAERAARLEDYERWGTPTQIDFAALVGDALWTEHWQNHAEVIAMMRRSEETAARIRALILEADRASHAREAAITDV